MNQFHKIWMAVDKIDFRNGIDGIAAICYQQWSLNPRQGHFFIFRNRRNNALRILFYHANGFWLCHKRLSTGTFKYWPPQSNAILSWKTYPLPLLLGDSFQILCRHH